MPPIWVRKPDSIWFKDVEDSFPNIRDLYGKIRDPMCAVADFWAQEFGAFFAARPMAATIFRRHAQLRAAAAGEAPRGSLGLVLVWLGILGTVLGGSWDLETLLTGLVGRLIVSVAGLVWVIPFMSWSISNYRYSAAVLQIHGPELRLSDVSQSGPLNVVWYSLLFVFTTTSRAPIWGPE